MKKILTLLLIVLIAAPDLSATTYYIAQTAGSYSSGSGPCSTAAAPSSYSTITLATFAGESPNPGDVIIPCGSFTLASNTAAMTISASGTTMSPILLSPDINVTFASPAWPTAGAFILSGSNIVASGGANYAVTGDTNAVIEATDNGTEGNAACIDGSCGTQISSEIFAVSGNNVTVKNFHIHNKYMHTTWTAPAITNISESGSDVTVTFASNLSAAFLIGAAQAWGVGVNGVSNSSYDTPINCGSPCVTVISASGNTLVYTYPGIATGLPTLTDGTGNVATIDAVDGSPAIFTTGASPQITGNYIDNTETGIQMGPNSGGTDTGSSLSFNSVTEVNRGIALAPTNGTIMVSPLVVGNSVWGTDGRWDDLSWNYHHDPSFIFFAGTNSGITGLLYAKNHIYGVFSDNPWGVTWNTSVLFMQANNIASLKNSYFIENIFGLTQGTYSVNAPNDSYFSLFASVVSGENVNHPPSVTASVLTSNVATLTGIFPSSCVSNGCVGSYLSTAGLTNGGGIFNVASQVVTASSTTSISFALTHANVTSASEAGNCSGGGSTACAYISNGDFSNNTFAYNTIVDGVGGTIISIGDPTGTAKYIGNVNVTSAGGAGLNLNAGSPVPWPTPVNYNYNFYLGQCSSNCWSVSDGNVNSFTGWQSYGFDPNSYYSSSSTGANLNATTYAPQSPSVLIPAGSPNLTSYAITLLETDFYGNSACRPSSGSNNWTAGAVCPGSVPNPPVNLTGFPELSFRNVMTTQTGEQQR